MALSPNGTQLYVTAEGLGVLSQFTLNGAGNPTLAGCVGDITGCSAPLELDSPAFALREAIRVVVSPDATHLYVASWGANNLAIFSLNGAGNPSFAGCIGNLTGCAATSPASALDQPTGLVITPDGRQLYVVGSGSLPTPAVESGTEKPAGNGPQEHDVSHFTLDAAGNPSFAGCVGGLAGCAAVPAAHALEGALAATVSPDGRQLYVAGTSDISHFTLDAAGDPSFDGCVGDLPGCAATGVPHVLYGANRLLISPNGGQLYVTSGSAYDVSHFTLNAAGEPTFVDCIGDLVGCGETRPLSALEGASGGTVSPDGTQLYVTTNHALVRFTLNGAGDPMYVGCVGDLPGCPGASPAEALDAGESVVANANGTQLYVAADTLDHLTVGRPPPAPRLPSNAFSFGKLKLNKRRGTAALLVRVPGPGSLLLSGAGVKTIFETGRAAAKLTLKLTPTGTAATRLKRTHRATVALEVIYTPTFGDPRTRRETVALIEG